MNSESLKDEFRPLRDEKQYKTTLRELGELRRAFDKEVNPNLNKYDPEVVAASKQAVDELIGELEERVRDYESRRNTTPPAYSFGGYAAGGRR
ncbi:MAG: hypothetical protein HND56_05545 [Pseudomonadota bacterium]|jgi:hypothetical protein|nr:hypothetical protein [Pseudomonadota bacterium]QKK05184.1 MAG: hypothetical protein HND56_05545 [Pseudomonadota bacterium]